MPAGEVLTASLRNSLKRSSALVLVVSAGALLHSHYMPREFDYYIGARRSPKIVPISIGRALDDAGPDLPLNQRVRNRADVIWISEREEQLTGGPSAEVLKALIDSFRFTRRNAIRNGVVSAVGLILVGLLVVSICMGIRAENQRRIAVIERDHARATLSHSDFLQALRLINEDRDSDATPQLVAQPVFRPGQRGSTLPAYRTPDLPHLGFSCCSFEA